jgi:2-polyprenyl-6-hydroxyphenyl methylase/3-demethylubiquinone-9 3-methyltransferase
MSTVLKSEIEKFSKDAGHWWDENGPFAPLHRLNPARMGYIRSQICQNYDLSATSLKPFKGLKVLDVGCGGGLVCEPMARLGADVTGIDADKVAIEVAKEHATAQNLKITYKAGEAADLKDKYDAVLALEIIEHVENPAEFVKTIAKLMKPGGLAVFSTLNRTPKSFALGIVAAEYVLGIVPRGTHSWRSFVRPSELSRHARAAKLEPSNISGLVLNPFTGEFQISASDMAVNYFLTTKKP